MLTIIAASMVEELVKGSGRVKWNAWREKLTRIIDGRGRARDQLEVIIQKKQMRKQLPP